MSEKDGSRNSGAAARSGASSMTLNDSSSRGRPKAAPGKVTVWEAQGRPGAVPFAPQTTSRSSERSSAVVPLPPFQPPPEAGPDELENPPDDVDIPLEEKRGSFLPAIIAAVAVWVIVAYLLLGR